MGQQQQTFLIIPKPRKQNNFSRKHTTKKSREEKERTQNQCEFHLKEKNVIWHPRNKFSDALFNGHCQMIQTCQMSEMFLCEKVKKKFFQRQSLP